MKKKYESDTGRLKKGSAELPYRQVRRANLERIGEMVLRCMGVAGDTPLPEKWQPMLEQIDSAYRENPEHLVVILWRVLCNFSVSKEKP